ncbi:hypothetical protein VTN00DRAFT_4944 [Thermoascus crustaceus]|uniref:uncharacterized protein n=1 Tax=Thermoascus crustaceus TaxID=5088 RepID=UPI003743D010
MAKKANNGTDPILRKSIREAILSRHQQNEPINREAIKAEYLSKNPNLANYINNIVNDYSDYLESKLKTANAAKSPTPAQASKDPSPISTSQHRSGSNIISKLPESHSKTELSLTESSASSSQLGPVADHRTSSGSDEELSSFDVVNSASSNGDGISDNVLLQVRVLTPEPEVVPKKRVAGFSSVCLSLLESLVLCSPPAAQVKTGGTLGCNLLELGERKAEADVWEGDWEARTLGHIGPMRSSPLFHYPHLDFAEIGIFHFSTASHQAHSVRTHTYPLLPPQADLASIKGFATCCLPCLTFGKTQARIQDPSLQNYSSINSECAIFTVLALGYCQWIIQTVRRGEMRQKHGIDGSCCGDCCVTFWCGCCALIQEEKEMELRTRPDQTGYQSTAQMAYPS